MKRSNTFSNANAKSQISLIRKPLANATSKANVTSTNALVNAKVNATVQNGEKKAIVKQFVRISFVNYIMYHTIMHHTIIYFLIGNQSKECI